MAGKAATAMQKMDLLRTPETGDPGVPQWEYKGEPVVPGSRAERRRRGRE